ncbi:MAG TPA: 50S ribosomal protein L6 [Rhodospirillaceae bacterium]|nr:50S ribosomal protein L6 [Rhodospirillaceae bacterium]
MSRVGKHPVSLPQGVTAEVKAGAVQVKGKLGTLSLAITSDVEVKLADNQLVVTPVDQSTKARMMWGTVRNNLANMVKGVSEGFKQVLEIEGVGFRAAMQGKDLVMQLGFSHEVRYPSPEGIEIKAEKPTVLSITGFDRQKVGQVAAEIRSMKKPEPYKGKGIKYAGERVRRKEGKKK